jgi:hypothetical protein
MEAVNSKGDTMSTSDYLSETVIYGGLEVTRGEMIADLQATAATYTDDPVRQQMFVSRYMQGFERA